MDATQQFLRQQEIQVPDKFVISGLSKVNQSNYEQNYFLRDSLFLAFSVDGQVSFFFQIVNGFSLK